MAMKICKECGTEISSSAKVCPKCGKSQQSFFSKHKALTVILAIILFGVIIGITGENDTRNTTETSSTSSENETVVGVITRENYDKINEGMSKEEVFAILGEDATISETNTPGIGTMELYHYQEFLSTKAIDITFLNEEVYSKSWIDL